MICICDIGYSNRLNLAGQSKATHPNSGLSHLRQSSDVDYPLLYSRPHILSRALLSLTNGVARCVPLIQQDPATFLARSIVSKQTSKC